MNGWLKLLLLLGIGVLGLFGLIYFRREILMLVKGMLGLVAILLIILAVVTLWEKAHKSS